MRLFGTVLGLVGRCLLPDQWKTLSHSLRDARARYLCSSQHSASSLFVIALIASEDRRFMHHRGVDPIAICRAASRLVWSHRVEGASTIEQQLVRVVTARYERTLRRKIREVLLAPLVETVVPKADIPGLYLSVAYFGAQMSGLSQACHRLGVDAARPSLCDAAAVVARITFPEPTKPSPMQAARILRRTEYVTRLLEERLRDRTVAVLAHASERIG